MAYAAVFETKLGWAVDVGDGRCIPFASKRGAEAAAELFRSGEDVPENCKLYETAALEKKADEN
jgi:hypothetical protein